MIRRSGWRLAIAVVSMPWWLASLADCGSSTSAPASSGAGAANDSATTSAGGATRGAGSSSASGAGQGGTSSSRAGASGSAAGDSGPTSATSASTSGPSGANGGASSSIAIGDAGAATDLDGASTPPSDSGTGRGEAGATDARSPEGGGTDGSAANDGGVGACGSAFGGGPVTTTTTHLDIGVHDPSMTWDGHRYYLFATGGLLGVRSSPDMRNWTGTGAIFASMPAWIKTTLGSAPGDLWAPDISYFNGAFHVYYAGSTFGTNSSVIGLATNVALDPANPAYAWHDEGLVVHTTSADNDNAIDPNVSFDAHCAPWLAFGSFWSGIKLHKLDPATGHLATDDPKTYSIASRGGGAIEAASIVSHNGYYYLFVSFDACCKGTSSTYRTMVGRATAITGPYVDKAGVDMMQGGADQLLASSGRYIGQGGGTAWRDGDTYLYVHHYYDAQAGGAPKLLVRPILFGPDNWVTLGDPLFP